MRNCILLILLSLEFFSPAWAQGPAAVWPTVGHDRRHTGRSRFAGPSQGTVSWKYFMEIFKCPLYASPAIGPDGTVYIGSEAGLHAVRPDGTQKWNFPSDTPYDNYGSPALARDGSLYFISSCDYGCDFDLHAVDSNGKLKWKLDIFATTEPTLGADGTIYLGGADAA